MVLPYMESAAEGVEMMLICRQRRRHIWLC
jgi:hypothetical protein